MLAFAKLFGGVFLGWNIGANNTGDIFGAAVGSGSISYKKAIVLFAAFAVVGSFLEGYKLYDSYTFDKTGEFQVSFSQASVATLSAGLSIMVQTYIGIPTSTTQNAIGGVMGIAILSKGLGGISWMKILGWLCCWILQPFMAGIVAFTCLKAGAYVLSRTVKRVDKLNLIYTIGLIVSGCYGAYTMGANNVVVSTAPFYQAGLFGGHGHYYAVLAASVGGVAIAIGALTFGRKVVQTVGEGITALDPFSALIAVLAQSLIVHFFTQIHVPVSASQAIVGAVAGAGFVRGARMVNAKMLVEILSWWILSPLISALLAIGIAYLAGIR